MAKQNSFVGDEGNSKAQVTELKVRPRLEEFLEEAGKGTDMTTVIPILIPDNFIAGSGEMRLVGFLTSLHIGVPDFSFNRPQFLILVTNRPNFSYF